MISVLVKPQVSSLEIKIVYHKGKNHNIFKNNPQIKCSYSIPTATAMFTCHPFIQKICRCTLCIHKKNLFETLLCNRSSGRLPTQVKCDRNMINWWNPYILTFPVSIWSDSKTSGLTAASKWGRSLQKKKYVNKKES